MLERRRKDTEERRGSLSMLVTASFARLDLEKVRVVPGFPEHCSAFDVFATSVYLKSIASSVFSIDSSSFASSSWTIVARFVFKRTTNLKITNLKNRERTCEDDDDAIERDDDVLWSGGVGFGGIASGGTAG